MKIETGVEIPSRKGGAGRVAVYPFGDMEVGESFRVDLSGEKTSRGHYVESIRISSALAAYNKRHPGRTFTIRTLRDEGIVRCWRIA